MKAFQLLPLATVAALLALLPSCTASLNLERFKADDAPLTPDVSNVSLFDFKFTGTQMQSHLREYFEIRVVDKANRIQAKAVYNNVITADFSIYLRKVIPKTNPPYRIDYWADHNSSGAYDGIVGSVNEKDHAWRRILSDPLLDSDVKLTGARYDLDFLHNVDFIDILTDLEGNPIPGTETLLPCTLKVKAPSDYVGMMVEFRIVDKGSGRLVGLHRQGGAQLEYKASISGILDEVTPYEVSGYVDVDDDGKYTALSDPSWMFDIDSTSKGLEAELDLAATEQTPIETGEN